MLFPKIPIPVYIDEVQVDKGILLLDFPPTSKSIEFDFKMAFMTNIGLESSLTESTMLEIRGIDFQNKPPRVGSYYFLPEVFFNQNFWTEVDSEDQESHFLAFKAEYNNSIAFSLGKALNRDEYLFFGEENEVENLEKALSILSAFSFNSSKIQLLAHDVGQGNCNQVFFGCCSFVMYDFGSREKSKLDNALTNFSSKLRADNIDCQLNTILNEGCNDKESNLRIFVLSHWDIDHYNAFNQMQQRIIDLFDLFVVPKEIPTDTAKRAFDRLPPDKTLRIEMRRRIGRGPNQLELIYTNDIFRLFRGSKSSNRNKSGLVLTVKTPNCNAILPADHHYDQINDTVYPYHNENELYFIVPHHGGHAGRVSIINNWLNLREVVYSVGNNQWGHPFGYVTGTYNALARINVRHDTRINSDYKKTMN